MSEPAPELDDRSPRQRRGTELALVHANPPESFPEPPQGAVLHPPPAHDPSRARTFLGQLWSEFALVGRMYFDPRYRISRTAQFAVPGIGLLLVLNYFLFNAWFPVIPVLTPITERIGCIVLGIALYKVIVRELGRYREVLDYLARFGIH